MKQSLAALFILCGFCGSASAQTVTAEVEPNGNKAEAMVVLGFAPGDSIVGTALGNNTDPGNATADSADTFEIETTARPTPGWYRYTLMINGGYSMTIRGLGTNGSVGAGSTVVLGTDRQMQSDTTINGNSLRWYANEQPSRLFVRVTGVMNSPPQYTITMIADLETPTSVPFVLDAGNITIDALNTGHTTNTEISIADDTRTVIPFWQNSSSPSSGSQAILTRNFTAGTYYLILTDWKLYTLSTAAADDGSLGHVMDYDNAIVNNNVNSTSRLDFEFIDSVASYPIPVNKQGTYSIRIFEFTVGVGVQQSFCFGDGGVSPGCTPCPCGNNAPVGQRVGCLNSNGQGAELIRSGLPAISGDTLHFDVVGANVSTFGLLVSAPNQLPQMGACPPGSGIAPPNFDGLRCVGGGLVRHGSRSFDVNGSTTNGWGPPAAPASGLAAQGGFVAGQTRNFQVFYRENPAFVCGTGQNTTNAINVIYIQ